MQLRCPFSFTRGYDDAIPITCRTYPEMIAELLQLIMVSNEVFTTTLTSLSAMSRAVVIEIMAEIPSNPIDLELI